MLRRCSALGFILLAACSAPPLHTPIPNGTLAVMVARRGWHVDVGFDVHELRGPLALVGARFPQAGYVFFGFGDERYIRATHHRLPGLLAALWPGRGVMLVTALQNTPAEAFGRASVTIIPLAPAQRDLLQQAIVSSFAGLAEGRAPLQQGPYEDSVYYRATPGYSGFHTCNTWAAEVLRAGGLPVRSRGVLVAGQLWSQVRPLDRAGAD